MRLIYHYSNLIPIEVFRMLLATAIETECFRQGLSFDRDVYRYRSGRLAQPVCLVASLYFVCS